MNRYTRSLLSVPLALAMAACASTGQDPRTSSPDPTSAQAEARSTTPAPFAAVESPAATHDMGGMSGAATSEAVEIVNFSFEPVDITVARGTEVTFTNLDAAPHTVTAGSDEAPSPELFDSGLLEQGEGFTFVFDEPGTYPYYCDRHPPMQASVTVEG